MRDTTLDIENVASNSAGFLNAAGGDEDPLPRDGNLEIEYKEESDSFGIFPNGEIFPAFRAWSAKLIKRERDVFRFADECRSKWTENTVDLEEDGSHPFQLTLDFTDRPDFIRRVCGQLAVAGERLFFNIFERDSDARLRDITEQLRIKSIEKELVLTITSKNFFIPWGMIYTHPHAEVELKTDGSNFEWEGFWGFRHIIEHNPEWVGRHNMLERNEENLICASMNLDENIDANLEIRSVAKQKQFFAQLVEDRVLHYQERSVKPQLGEALEADDFSDRILYFYCHGSAGDVDNRAAQIMLTDGEPINDTDFAFWLREHLELKTHPLIFINACKGGQMTTMFFKTFATELLEKRARGLIGAQIDVPAEFGEVYAKHLFSEFLKSSQPPHVKIRLGPLMRDLARKFIHEYQNPLGLIYSLYRGLDVYVDRRPPVRDFAENSDYTH
jgi:hypothetical protein